DTGCITYGQDLPLCCQGLNDSVVSTKDAIKEGSFSKILPTTAISAPASKAALNFPASEIPPPIISGILSDCLTMFIVSALMQFLAPLPASIYINFNPSISPAMAVATAMPGFPAGIGLVWLIYSTEVGEPPSISIYPVAMGSILFCFINGAATI